VQATQSKSLILEDVLASEVILDSNWKTDYENLVGGNQPLQTKELVSAEGIESATKRSFNNMQGHG